MKLPQSERAWIGGGVAIAILLSGMAYFGAISPELSHASSLRSQRADAETQNDILLSRTNKLRQDSADLPKLTASLQSALAGLPVSAQLSQMTDQLYRQAALVKVTLTSITVATPTDVAVAAPAAPTTKSAAGAAATAGSAGGTSALPITIISTGRLAAQQKFLAEIQRVGPRIALVSATKLVPLGAPANGIDGAATMTTQLQVFVTPLSASAAAQLSSELAKGSSN